MPNLKYMPSFMSENRRSLITRGDVTIILPCSRARARVGVVQLSKVTIDADVDRVFVTPFGIGDVCSPTGRAGNVSPRCEADLDSIRLARFAQRSQRTLQSRLLALGQISTFQRLSASIVGSGC